MKIIFNANNYFAWKVEKARMSFRVSECQNTRPSEILKIRHSTIEKVKVVTRLVFISNALKIINTNMEIKDNILFSLSLIKFY